MKFVFALILMSFPVWAADDVKFDLNGRPSQIELAGRERPVSLPHNVYVKEYKKLNNNSWVLLLFRYRSDEYTSSDYFSILVLKRKSENMEWVVNFKLFQPEMSELFQEDFWVVELGPIKESENVILKVGRVGSEKNPEKTGMFWETWNLDSEKRLETLRRTRPFAKFDAE